MLGLVLFSICSVWMCSFPAMWSPRILVASWFVFVAAILLAALRDGGVGGEDRSRADLGRLLLPVPFVAQFSGEWVAVQAPLLRAGAGVFGDGGRRSMLARLALCFISAKGWEPFPAIVFLDGGGGQCMPVFTCCGDGRCA